MNHSMYFKKTNRMEHYYWAADNDKYLTQTLEAYETVNLLT